MSRLKDRDLGFNKLEEPENLVHFSRLRPGTRVRISEPPHELTVVEIDPTELVVSLLTSTGTTVHRPILREHWYPLREPYEQYDTDEDCLAKRLMQLNESSLVTVVLHAIASEHKDRSQSMRVVKLDDENIIDEDDIESMLLGSYCKQTAERLVFWQDVLSQLGRIVMGRAPRQLYYCEAHAHAWETAAQYLRNCTRTDVDCPVDQSLIS